MRPALSRVKCIECPTRVASGITQPWSPQMRHRILFYGEIYRLTSADLFDLLDDYEACGPNTPKPHEYVRQIADVRTDDDQVLQTNIYLYARSTDGLELISDGIFR